MRRLLLLLCLLVLAAALGAAAFARAEPADEPAPAGSVAERGQLAAPTQRAAKRRRPSPPIGAKAALLAHRWLGVGYAWGGSSPSSGFDCSGFTSYVYGRLGVELPHNAAAQFGRGRPVPRARLRPGDLLFFRGLGHVGMYVGRGRMIHAPQSGDVVRVVRLGVDYRGELVGARRLTAAHVTRQ